MLDTSRGRPARYRQGHTHQQQQERVPPRYHRSGDVDTPLDELAIVEVVRGISILIISTLLFLTVQRYLFEDSRDPFKCSAVVNEGRWIRSSTKPGLSITQWQPPGCLMHTYKDEDVQSCLFNRRLLFVGDSYVKTIFYAAARKLTPGGIRDFTEDDWEKDEELHSGSVKLQFVWDPFLNSSRLAEELEPWKNGTVDPFATAARERGYDPPAIFLAGTGFWFALKEMGLENTLHTWRQAVDGVTEHMRGGPRPTYLGRRDTVFLAPAPHPEWERFPPTFRDKITQQYVIDINKYVNQLSIIEGMDIPRSWRAMSDDEVPLAYGGEVFRAGKLSDRGKDEEDVEAWELARGRVRHGIAQRRIDQLLNVRCNDILVNSRLNDTKFDKTCCIKYPPPNMLQAVVLLSTYFVMPAIILMRWKYPNGRIAKMTPSGNILKHTWYLLLGLLLCFYIDRTPFSNKSHKLYSDTRFWKVMFGLFVASLATLQKPPADMPPKAQESRVWNEWKGAALGIHLTSAYLGLSEDFSTFALLFIFSAEQTVKMLQHVGVSLHEFVKTVAELNVLAVPMVFMMRTEYTAFKLPALYTFWFCALSIAANLVRDYRPTWFLFVKLNATVTVVMVCFSTGTYGVIYRFASSALMIRWEIETFRAYVLNYVWAVYVGVLVGVLYFKYSLLSTDKRRKWEMYGSVAVISLAVGYIFVLQYGTDGWGKDFGTFTALARLANFAIMRLTTELVRSRQSELLVLLGSLQIPALSIINHAWNAGDGEGVVDLGFFWNDDTGTVLNWLATALIFGYTCWSLRDAGETVAGWFVGDRSDQSGTGGGKSVAAVRMEKKLHSMSEKELEEEVVGLEDIVNGTGMNGHGNGSYATWRSAAARNKSSAGDLRLKAVAAAGLIWILNFFTY